MEGKLVARCPPTPQPLLKDGPVRNETGERKASYAQCIGGVWGSGEQWGLCAQPPGIWLRSQPWVWLGLLQAGPP